MSTIIRYANERMQLDPMFAHRETGPVHLLFELPVPIRAPSPAQPAQMVKVTNTLLAPFRCICRIVTRAYDKPDNEYSVGTGVLISPYHVLTCAHNIYPGEAPNTGTIDVFPAQNGPDDSAVRFRSNGWAVNPEWRRNDCSTAGQDYGIIRLTKDTRHGFFQLRPFDPAILTRATVHLAGYPGNRDRRAQYMYQSTGAVTGEIAIAGCGQDSQGKITMQGRVLSSISPSASFVAHDLAASHAVSGGPMWIEQDGVRTLIGLHAQLIDDGKRRGAVLLNNAVLSRISGWMKKELRP